MKSKIKAIVLIVIILAGSFVYSHIDKSNMIYDKHYDDSEYLQTGVVTEGTIAQKFVCKENSLDGINVKTVVIGDVTDVIIEYSIVDVTTGEKYSGNVSAIEMKNNKYYFFSPEERFENCKGDEFQFEIKEKGVEASRGISFYLTPTANQDTALYVNESNTDGTIIMKVITHRFDVETFVVLLISIGFIIVFMRVLYRLFNK